MNFHKIKVIRSSFVLFVLLVSAVAVFAQDNKSTLIFDEMEKDWAVAVGNNLYCAGYIQSSSFNTKYEIVGATEEKDKHIYAEADHLYLNVGSVDGVKAGDRFSVIRPRGKFRTEFSNKKNLGVYVQEVGEVEVINVMRDVSVAKVMTSCSSILLGDLVTPVPNRVSPMFKKRPALDIYAASSGKARGRIVMARGNQELLTAENIVYVDLGREDNVQVGDYMTIFRPLGTGNIFKGVLSESLDNKEEGYESDRYNGGRYSNQAARKKGSNGNGDVVTTENAKSRRPDGLRRVVGELIVLNVLEKTATAMIVRNASEIHTGDYVELQ